MRRSLHAACAAVAAVAACSETRTESPAVAAPDRAAPLVLFTSPGDRATAVPRNARVSATFTEAMDRATLAGVLGVAGPRGAVIGAAAVSDDARSVTFTPAEPLDPGAVHTASLAPGARDLAGNPLAPTRWAFVTGTAPEWDPPHVVSLSPAPGVLASVPLATAVSATFDEPIDCGALPRSALAVFELGAPVNGYVACEGATLSFVTFPAAPGNTTLLAVLSPLVRDLAGNLLAAGETWSFEVLPWTRLIGSAGTDAAYALARDGSGHLLVAGATSGDLGEGEVQGGADAFVAKLGPAGDTEWVRPLGTGGMDLAGAVAVDASGNVLVAGLEGQLAGSTTSGDAFVAKLDPAGTLLWRRTLATAAPERAWAVTAAPDGAVVVVGETAGALGSPGAGGVDPFVAKLAPDGAILWLRQDGTPQDDLARGVATDGSGSVAVAGTTGGRYAGATSRGARDVFLLRYDAAGALGAAVQLGTPADDALTALAADPAGHLFLAGTTGGALGRILPIPVPRSAAVAGLPTPVARSPADAGLHAQVVVTGALADAFVAKLAPSGATEWVSQLGSASTFDQPTAIAVDAGGNVVVAGQLHAFDGFPPLVGTGFVAKLGVLGDLLWLDTEPLALMRLGAGVVVDPFGNAFVAAPAGPLDGAAGAGGVDAAVLRYGPDGRRR